MAFDPDGTKGNPFRKTEADVVEYDMPWSEWLPSGDTINSSAWEVPTGITADSDSFTDTTTTIWLSGGEDGKTYRLVNKIVTAQGRTKEDDLWIEVKDKVASVTG